MKIFRKLFKLEFEVQKVHFEASKKLTFGYRIEDNSDIYKFLNNKYE